VPSTAPAVVATKSTANLGKSIRFLTSSKVLTTAHKNTLKKSVKASGKDATYVVTGTAGFLPGVTEVQVKKLATVRANTVKAYLVKLGVNKANITIKIKTTNQGIVPKTKTLAKYLVS
jgi:outer membrane protein OmpA-like peptidoglycan-associated protein